MDTADLIVHNGKIATLAPANTEARAAAVSGGRFAAVGDDADVLELRGPNTQVIDLGGRRVIPGLNASPNAMFLYATLAKGPKLPPEHQTNSTRHFMRELNRLGLTSAIDAGGGFQNYPDDYRVMEELHRQGEMTVRVAYNLFTQHP